MKRSAGPVIPLPASASDHALISLLQRNNGRYYSGSRLAEQLDVTRAAIHKQIRGLRTLGYDIRGTNRMGYRLRPSPHGLDPSALTGRFGRPFLYYRVLASTQEEAKRRALLGAPEGTVVSADRQTAGRGRLGRGWYSPRGGLWFSLVMRPRINPSAVPALTLVAALDLARTIQRTAGLEALVKWPNDVRVGTRKVAGILTEMSSEVDRVHWVVLGVGININNRPPRRTEMPAASLADLAGKGVSRQAVLRIWLSLFEKSYGLYLRGGFGAFRAAYNRFFGLRGRRIQLREGETVCFGKVIGVDIEGRLEVVIGGKVRRVSSGEIRILA